MIETTRLGDIVEITNGYAFKSSEYVTSGIRVIRITNVQKGSIVDNTPQFYPHETQAILERYSINEGDILMSLTGNVGRVGRFPKELLPAYINQRVCRVKSCTSKLDDDYLFYILTSDLFERDAIENSAGVAQLNLSTKWIENYLIPLPPLAEQKHIAAILDAADNLRQKDQQLVEHYTALSQSLFLEMFGDPFEGDTYPLDDHISILGGYAFKSEDYIKEEGIPLIKIGTVNRGYFDDTNFSFLPESFISKYEKWLVKKGDILMSLTGTVGKDDYGNVAMASDTYEKYFLNQRVAKISSINKSYHPEFLFGMFSNTRTKQELTKISRGVRQANISNRDIYSLKMIKPTLHEQNKYIAAINSIEQQKQQAQANLKKSEALFNSLLQRAFTGELTADKAA